ncbi:hypothetical protein FBG13_03820 [Cobetia marina]|uniref:hypothetical protein n=1 Tax=Cobetia marina TaxID=28258 RepID=UPI0010ADA5E6|nr:hypothetical protein [Cobetia marina]TKD64381.1 hypothetical protein FBG13_03820 [Cobetia marina]GED43239.1 hypothetical protein HHA02_25680 [Cobetia marina]
MKTFNALIAAAVLSVTTAGVANADSVADQQVRATISESVIHGQAQQAAAQPLHLNDAGKSVAASRVEQALNNQSVNGQQAQITRDSRQYVNDAGKSVSATRVQHALSESV